MNEPNNDFDCCIQNKKFLIVLTLGKKGHYVRIFQKRHTNLKMATLVPYSQKIF